MKNKFQEWADEWGIEACQNIRGALADAWKAAIATVRTRYYETEFSCEGCCDAIWNGIDEDDWDELADTSMPEECGKDVT